MIRLENIYKTYGGGDVPETHALSGVNLEINEGEFLAIMGPSGSGKSTLMHILGFLDQPTKGKYFFNDKEISFENDDFLANLRNESVGFVFQAFNLLPRTTVLENVQLPLVYAGVTKEQMAKRAKKALKEVGLEGRLNHYSNQLSGGEKQRVAIARALVNDPKVIFADEPTGNLDSASGAQIMEILQELNDAGRTIILVTHEMFAAESAKRIIALRDGKIVKDEEVRKRKIVKRDGFSK